MCDTIYIETLYQYGIRIKVKKGDYIYNANTSSDEHNVYFLDSGLCALTSVTKSGEEKIYLYFHGKRTISFMHLMSKEFPPKHQLKENNAFYIIAKTDCILYKITEDVFYNLLKQEPKFTEFMLYILTKNYIDMLNRYRQVQEESATVRLCYLLIEYAKEKDGKKIVPKYFTYVELAKYLGIHSVTVARIMSKLKQYGYISKKGHSIVIEQIDQLEILIESGLDLN